MSVTSAGFGVAIQSNTCAEVVPSTRRI